MKTVTLLAFTILFATVCLAQSDVVTKDYLIGNVDPATDTRFTKFGPFYMRNEVAESFKKMQIDAGRDGVRFDVISAMRTFSHQKRIWENKWRGVTPVNTDTNEFLPKIKTSNVIVKLTDEQRAKKILEVTAMPSTSRHHWGTDIDLNNVNPSYWSTPKGKKEYDWLSENAAKYGFCQVYSGNRSLGHDEEKWHWSYLPLSKPLTDQFIKEVTNEVIAQSVFLGSGTAEQLDPLGKYVSAIDPRCR
ncbi:MAG: M15 family metallopeptidase [Pyrinomonadaceae bacterium]|jgi:zinc D-Ala-D-Ala carboxypeptidase|nr:M15 family metallopeptidase [Pyrinomonadaceae bacterium]